VFVFVTEKGTMNEQSLSVFWTVNAHATDICLTILFDVNL